MINITRSEEVPSSLTGKKIQDYLEAIKVWETDKSQEEPKSPVEYRTKEVLEALDNCFHKKCYITEERAWDNVAEFEIDHFYPKNEYPHLRYEWSNLYPITSDANKMRPKKLPEGGLLDPCSVEDDVENEILYDLETMGTKIMFTAKDKSNPKAVNTAALLDEIHNATSKSEVVKMKTAGLREKIRKAYINLNKAIKNWKDAQTSDDRAKTEKRLKLLLSRKSSFTMLLRSTSVVRKHVPSDFLD